MTKQSNGQMNWLNEISGELSTNWDLMDELPAAIYTCDINGKITFFNKTAAELWGRKPVVGKDLWCGSWKIYYLDGIPMPLDKCPMSIALNDKKPVKGAEIIIERPDGSRINVLPHPRPLFDSMGKCYGAINMLVDITDRKAQDIALRKRETEYRLLSESLEKQVEERTLAAKKNEERYHKMVDEVEDYAILLLDVNGNILNWNKGAEKIKGYSEEEIIGKSFRQFYLDNDRKHKLPDKLLQRAKTEGKAIHEGWRLRKDGSKFWGTIVITALHGEHNEIIGFTKVTRDLTERKLADEKVQKFAREVENRNKQLQEYAYIASHDMQEPLRKIQVFADLLERNIKEEQSAKKYLQKINSSAKRMVALIKGVLLYSQVDQADELFAEIDLNEILKNVEEEYELIIEEKSARITYPEMPVIRGIPIQMHQLFSNLINNSLKFTDKEPRIKISVEKLKDVEKIHPKLNKRKDYWKITFTDNGRGFEGRYADQVFELFKRLDASVKGVGIGLALCKRIIDKHNGHIQVKSKPGQGTTFMIFLPA